MHPTHERLGHLGCGPVRALEEVKSAGLAQERNREAHGRAGVEGGHLSGPMSCDTSSGGADGAGSPPSPTVAG
jgi:hypothetical protein